MTPQEEKIEITQTLREGTHLSKWEEDFLDSIIEQLERGRTLTEAQEDKLRQIQKKE